MKRRTILTLILLLLASLANATGGSRDNNEQEQHQDQTQHQGQSQEQESNAEAQAEAHASGSAEQMQSAAGGTANVEMRSENTSINTVLVPNNNTEACLRVFGFSFGNGDGAGAFGIPWRSKPCDYEQAADDAAATGDHSLAWFWRCHKKNIRAPFERRGSTNEQATEACWRRMTQFLTLEADQHTREIEYLRREVEMLRDQVELTEETCDRQWESCVGGKDYE